MRIYFIFILFAPKSNNAGSRVKSRRARCLSQRRIPNGSDGLELTSNKPNERLHHPRVYLHQIPKRIILRTRAVRQIRYYIISHFYFDFNAYINVDRYTVHGSITVICFLINENYFHISYTQFSMFIFHIPLYSSERANNVYTYVHVSLLHTHCV